MQAVSPSYQINMNLCFIWLNLIKVKLHRDWVTSSTTSKEIAVEKVNYSRSIRNVKDVAVSKKMVNSNDFVMIDVIMSYSISSNSEE